MTDLNREKMKEDELRVCLKSGIYSSNLINHHDRALSAKYVREGNQVLSEFTDNQYILYNDPTNYTEYLS